jgi:hypothetical protein
VLSTNVVGYVCVIHAFLPLLEHSENPRIINVSSGLGSFGRFHDEGRIESRFGSPLYEGVLFRRVRERLSELEHERLLKFKELQALEAEQLETGPEAVELLDELPIGEGIFTSAPADVLRQLFQTFRLEVRFDKPSHRANCQVTIDEGSVASLGSDSAEHSVSPG